MILGGVGGFNRLKCCNDSIDTQLPFGILQGDNNTHQNHTHRHVCCTSDHLHIHSTAAQITAHTSPISSVYGAYILHISYSKMGYISYNPKKGNKNIMALHTSRPHPFLT